MHHRRQPRPDAAVADCRRDHPKFAVPYIEQLRRLIDQGAVQPPDNLVAFVLTPGGREWCHGQRNQGRGLLTVKQNPKPRRRSRRMRAAHPGRGSGTPRKDANAPAPDA